MRARDVETIIGLEIHAQLLTETKMFCACRARFGEEPNTQVCPVCLGLPGALPVLNRKAVELALLVGLATHSTINPRSSFARKNYFYPDLPKNFQISQYDAPLCTNGRVTILKGTEKCSIGLTRIHLEEDAGKSIHSEGNSPGTLIDLNRCGVPLLEIVTLPDMREPGEARLFLITLKQILEYLGASSGNMEEGSLRCDVNVSVRRVGDTKLGARTEIKNLNSFRNIERALEYEAKRQEELYLRGGAIAHETLLWDAVSEKAVAMRSKEEAHDYRYFPEPDLLVLEVGEEWVRELESRLPELPRERELRLMETYRLPPYDAGVLCATRELAAYFEEVAALCGDPKLASNWVMTEVLREAKGRDRALCDFPVSAHNLAELLRLISAGSVSGKMAKELFAEMVETGRSVGDLAKERSLSQLSDAGELRRIVTEVVSENPRPVADYFGGREKSFGFLVGQIMKKTSGRANPPLANRLLREHLEKLKEGGERR